MNKSYRKTDRSVSLLEANLFANLFAVPLFGVLLPTFAAFILGNGWLLSFGLLFTWTAAGDFTVLWLLRNVKPGTLVEDHPDRAGCVLLEKVG
jgi:uncharacterized membrane protein